MEPDKVFLKKLWNFKWTRWLLMLALGWQAISGLKDLADPLFKNVLRPTYTYISGAKPDPDDISNDRHAFLAGYEIYQIYLYMRTGAAKATPIEFVDHRNRLEASLMSLGFSNSALIHDINPMHSLDALERYQRVRSLIEAHLDKQGESSIAAFYAGLDLALLVEESSAAHISSPTITTYVTDLKGRLNVIRRAAEPHRLPTIPVEEVPQGDSVSNLQMVFVDSYIALKKFYGVASS